MARPIKETPILRGEDARRFEEEMKRTEQGLNKISKEEYERAMRVYRRTIVED